MEVYGFKNSEFARFTGLLHLWRRGQLWISDRPENGRLILDRRATKSPLLESQLDLLKDGNNAVMTVTAVRLGYNNYNYNWDLWKDNVSLSAGKKVQSSGSNAVCKSDHISRLSAEAAWNSVNLFGRCSTLVCTFPPYMCKDMLAGEQCVERC